MTLHSKLPQATTSIFAIMSKMAADYKAVNLSQGFPDFPVAPELIELVSAAMKEGKNQYAPMPGLPILRENIAKKIEQLYRTNINPATEITITAGGTQALFAAITALVFEGDEVIMFDPAYDSYAPVIKLNRGIPIHLELKAPLFGIDWNEVEAKISPKTKAIIINTPHNPTGAVLSKTDLKKLEALVVKHTIYVISDEVYEHIIFDGKTHESILKYPAIYANGIAVFSFGKTFHATGWKTGYMVAPPKITKELRKMHQFNVFATNTPVQYGIAEYIKNEENYLPLPKFYQAKRDRFAELLSGSRFEPHNCYGTYFQLFSYDKISNKPDTEMAEWMTKEHGIATIPASVFYKNGAHINYLRICFAKSEETLQQAAEILCKI
ncbi:MAG: methionine aminotransferase [Cyclobacteriaceae bacterium]|nr:methionine aminotransferase [Cyclobacteriaceae bacterium]